MGAWVAGGVPVAFIGAFDSPGDGFVGRAVVPEMAQGRLDRALSIVDDFPNGGRPSPAGITAH